MQDKHETLTTAQKQAELERLISQESYRRTDTTVSMRKSITALLADKDIVVTADMVAHACTVRNKDVTKDSLKEAAGTSLLHDSVSVARILINEFIARTPDKVLELLSKKDNRGDNPMIHALRVGDEESLKPILAALPQDTNPDIWKRDNDVTVLHIACRRIGEKVSDTNEMLGTLLDSGKIPLAIYSINKIKDTSGRGTDIIPFDPTYEIYDTQLNKSARDRIHAAKQLAVSQEEEKSKTPSPRVDTVRGAPGIERQMSVLSLRGNS